MAQFIFSNWLTLVSLIQHKIRLIKQQASSQLLLDLLMKQAALARLDGMGKECGPASNPERRCLENTTLVLPWNVLSVVGGLRTDSYGRWSYSAAVTPLPLLRCSMRAQAARVAGWRVKRLDRRSLHSARRRGPFHSGLLGESMQPLGYLTAARPSAAPSAARAATPFTFCLPLARSHSVNSGPTPAPAISTLPDSSASLTAEPPESFRNPP